MSPLKSSAIRIVEAVFALGIAYVAMVVFHVNSELVIGAVAAILLGAVEYAKKDPSCPLPDYTK